MKKKIIGSSILLLVCLLGLFTTSYANDISLAQFKNYVVNVGIKQGLNESNVITYIDSSSGFSSFVNATSNVFENPDIDLYFLNTGYNIWFYYFPHNTTNKIVVRNKNDVDITISGSFTGYQINLSSPDMFRTTTATTYNVTKNYYYYSDLTMFDGWGSTIWKSPPVYWTSSAIFDGPYEDIPPFAFVNEPGLGTVMYDNYEYTLFNKPSSGDILLGQLFVPNGIVVNYADILNYYWYWNNWQVREFSDDCIRTQLVSNNDLNLVFNVFLKRDYIYNNTYYQYIFTSTQTEPYQFVSGGCYIKDSHTVITNGVVDPNNTFSGDYKDEYDGIIDNQQDVNNISEAIGDTILDDSEVDNMLSGFNTSGDILNTLGYSPLENPFSSVILRVMQALNDVLLGSGDVTLDISAFELDMEINSSDFTLPSGLIKNFVSLVCNGFVIWLIYKYGFKLYMMINTGKFKNLIDETTNTNVNLF